MVRGSVVAVVILYSLVVQHTTTAIRCSEAASKVLPCEGFLLSGKATPSAACCGGVQSLDKMAADSDEDRRAICRCFRTLSRSFPVNLNKAQLIPQLCHVTIHINVTPNIDCDRI